MWLDPGFFSWAMGIPSSEKNFWTVRMWAAGMASGGEIIRKSSKRWMIWGWRNSVMSVMSVMSVGWERNARVSHSIALPGFIPATALPRPL